MASHVTARPVAGTESQYVPNDPTLRIYRPSIAGGLDPQSKQGFGPEVKVTVVYSRSSAHSVHNEGITVDGKISIQKIQERDPGLHDAIVNGLPWRMITKAVAQNFPPLLPLIQQCGNASLVKGEGELQILRRLHSHSMAA